MSVLSTLKFWDGGSPYGDLAENLAGIKGDADALILFPYDDGTFWLKPGNFDKELIGGQGGYETPDEEKVILDGDGEPVRDLLGVPLLLAVDPTEHAAAVEPIKALVAQKNNIGEWLRVDSTGAIVEVGEALAAADEAVADPDELDIDVPDIGVGQSEDVAAKLQERDVPPEQAKPRHLQQALHAVAEDGDLRKVFDIAPPSAPALVEAGVDDDTLDAVAEAIAEGAPVAPTLDAAGIEADADAVTEALFPDTDGDGVVATDGGSVLSRFRGNGDVDHEPAATEPVLPSVDEVREVVTAHAEPSATVERATHIAVDQSKAADLLPTTTNTTELQTAIDKARNEEYDEGKVKETMILGIVIGAVIGGVFAIIMAVLFAIM